VAVENRAVGRARNGVERLAIDEGRRIPMIQIERIALGEEDRELPAFGPEPEAVFATIRADVRARLGQRPGWRILEVGAVDPAEAVADVVGGGAAHHAA